MKLIVGLGNPGEKYASNRHNIGFMAVDEIARGYSFGPWKKRFQGVAAEGQIGFEKCILLKPNTYMNESGRSVGEAMRFYKVPVGNVIVIHDEIDLQPGKIRLKTGGGNAGHNGLKSISGYIGNEYVRVRLGVGHPGDKALVANYVLQDFAKVDKSWLEPLLDGVARGMARLVEGSEAAFLSEAARSRTAAPAKANGVAAPVKPTVEADKATDIEVILAAASKPIQAMPMQTLPAAAREGGVSTFSRPAVIEPQPVPVAPVAEKKVVELPVAPAVPTTVLKEEPLKPEITAKAPSPAEVRKVAAKTPEPIKAEVKTPLPIEPLKVAAKATEPMKPAAKKGGLSSWFLSRVRGGSSR